MQKKKFIVTLLFTVLSIFMITACSDSSNESNSGGNNGGGGTVQPEPNSVKEFYNILTWDDNSLYSQYAILYDGSLYAWGNNNYGQLGLGITDENVDQQNKKKVNIPDKINQLTVESDEIYDRVSDSYITKSSFYAITENGELYVWGDNSDGQLGIGNTDNQTKPIKVTGITGKIKELGTYTVYGLSIYGSSIYAITEDGSLYAWGNNYFSTLGLGDRVDRNTPTKVNLPGKIKELRSYFNSVYALMEDSSLYTWGKNTHGRLGLGSNEEQISTPTLVTGINGTIKELINDSSIYAITEDNSLYAWGSNDSGQLGVGDEVHKNIPTKVNLPGKIKEFTGGSYAIMEDGSLYAWGYNYSGQLGVGDDLDRNTPTKVNLPSKIKELITGSSIYAILEDGSLYTWGYNYFGQLGVGDEINRNTPTKVNLSGTIKEIINNITNIYAILEDGSLYAWGDNRDGHLGVGDKVNKNTPTKVNLPSKIKELITGLTIYAILEDNSLYAWGSNYKGMLGVGNNEENITIPTLINGITGTIKKVISESHSDNRYFLTEDGLLYGTGSNYSNYPVKIEFKDK